MLPTAQAWQLQGQHPGYNAEDNFEMCVNRGFADGFWMLLP